MMCRLVFVSLLELKTLVKVWDIIFYLPRESDVGASWVFLVTTLELMGGGSVVAMEDAWTSTLLKKGWCLACFGKSAWSWSLA